MFGDDKDGDETAALTDGPENGGAAELGRRGGLKGGKARAAKMTADERSEAAREAVIARWDEARGVQRAMYDGVIRLGNVEIECAVLPGGVRRYERRVSKNSVPRLTPRLCAPCTMVLPKSPEFR